MGLKSRAKRGRRRHGEGPIARVERDDDLDNPRQLRGLYARVMAEGLDDDGRCYIDLDVFAHIWAEPRRSRWESWLRDRGLIE